MANHVPLVARVRRVALLGALLTSACQFSDIPGFQQPQLPIDTTAPRAPQDILAWLRDSSTSVRSLAFDDTAWSDLEPLGEVIGTRRVVVLGEQSGGDGTTLQAKARLVRFLHERLGFDVLVFEGGWYDLRVANEQLRAGASTPTSLRRALPAPWRTSAELEPLLRWLETRARSTRPLQLAGLDPRFTSPSGSLTAQLPGAALETYLRRYDSRLPDDAAWPALRTALDEVAVAGERHIRVDSATQPALDAGLQQLRAETNRLVNIAPEPEAAYWRGLVSALQVRELWTARIAAGQRDTAEVLRQDEMAEALVTLVQAIHREQRIIVWTSSALARRSSVGVTSPGGTTVSLGALGFGETARAILGDDQVYAIAFLAGSGSYGPFATGTAVRPLVRPVPESWDGLFLSAGRPNAFLHLRRPITLDNAWLYQRRVARALGYQQYNASWPAFFDGFFFTSEMTPISTTTAGATR
jgi:erythromycin esterase